MSHLDRRHHALKLWEATSAIHGSRKEQPVGCTQGKEKSLLHHLPSCATEGPQNGHTEFAQIRRVDHPRDGIHLEDHQLLVGSEHCPLDPTNPNLIATAAQM